MLACLSCPRTLAAHIRTEYLVHSSNMELVFAATESPRMIPTGGAIRFLSSVRLAPPTNSELTSEWLMGIALTALSINAPPSAGPHEHRKSKLEVAASARCQEVGVVREFRHPWEPDNRGCARGGVQVRIFFKVERNAEHRTTPCFEHDGCWGLEPHHSSAFASPSNEGAYGVYTYGRDFNGE